MAAAIPTAPETNAVRIVLCSFRSSGPGSASAPTRQRGLYAGPVALQTAAEVRARVDALARARPGGVVATDGDGTLWTGDVGEDLFHAFLEHGRVEAPAADAIRREAREQRLSDAGTGQEVARRIYDAYVEGRFPEER